MDILTKNCQDLDKTDDILDSIVNLTVDTSKKQLLIKSIRCTKVNIDKLTKFPDIVQNWEDVPNFELEKLQNSKSFKYPVLANRFFIRHAAFKFTFMAKNKPSKRRKALYYYPSIDSKYTDLAFFFAIPLAKK